MTTAIALPSAALVPRRAFFFRKHSVLPGFSLALGYSVVYLALIVLIPLAAVFLKSSTLGWEGFWHVTTQPRVLASFKLSFGASLIAAGIDVVFGLILAWVLVRYRFPGKRLVDALIDLPFALPTTVAGIALATVELTGDEAIISGGRIEVTVFRDTLCQLGVKEGDKVRLKPQRVRVFPAVGTSAALVPDYSEYSI